MGPHEEQIIKLTVAALFLVTAGGLAFGYHRRRRRMATWLRAPATVTKAWAEQVGENRVWQSWAAYEFRTATGGPAEGRWTTAEHHQRGDVIEIWYDPSRPEENRAGFADATTWRRVALPGGLVCLAIGLLALVDGSGLVDLGWDVTG